MSGKFRVVKLLKNHLYPTYQLHAFMANDSMAPEDGLRIAALTTMQWLRARLEGDAPPEWEGIPAPEEYLSATNDDLPSLYLNQGHVINIVSLPDKGMWTLQITEPDLGSDPGNPEQQRPAIPGRVIETNIAFRIVGKQLECGFKTVISDPVGTEPEAEVYRIAVVRELMKNPDFGLRQVTDLPMTPVRLKTSSQVKTMLYVTHHEDNALPTVIFTQPLEERKTVPDFSGRGGLRSGSLLPVPDPLPGFPAMGLPGQTPGAADAAAVDPPYDLEKFCYYTFSHCRTYVLEQSAGKSFSSQSGIVYNPGDTVVIYPTAYGGGKEVIPLKVSDREREETLKLIEYGVKSYLRSRPIDYGNIVFLSGAWEHLLRLSDEVLENAEAAGAGFRQELEQLKTRWKDASAEKDRELDAANSQLRRQKEYSARLESEKAELRSSFADEKDRMQAELDSYRETVECLRRRCDQPKDYDGIEAWVGKYFGGRLLLHPKAVSRMLTKSNQCADVSLVCDALDYLATDYWEQRYCQLSKETALTRCGRKYGRPFDVSPIRQTTIGFTPEEYRIKYFKNAKGKKVSSDLDFHLRVGNDSENLLRIYFLHDDSNRLIVVGSLPDHLRNVKIQ